MRQLLLAMSLEPAMIHHLGLWLSEDATGLDFQNDILTWLTVS